MIFVENVILDNIYSLDLSFTLLAITVYQNKVSERTFHIHFDVK